MRFLPGVRIAWRSRGDPRRRDQEAAGSGAYLYESNLSPWDRAERCWFFSVSPDQRGGGELQGNRSSELQPLGHAYTGKRADDVGGRTRPKPEDQFCRNAFSDLQYRMPTRFSGSRNVPIGSSANPGAILFENQPMRILITADLHYREQWFRLLSRPAECDLVCIAGDLLDMFND